MTRDEFIKRELTNLAKMEKDFGLSGLSQILQARLESGWVCKVDDCLEILSPKVAKFSKSKYRDYLCMRHQKELEGELSSKWTDTAATV